MNYKGITLLCVMMLLFLAIASFPVSAQAKDQDAGILIIYSTLDGKESSQVKMLDLLAGHFTSHVTVKKDSDVEASDFKGKDHVIYYGQTKRKLSQKLLSLISGVKKPVVAIGYNVGQISQFSGLSLARKENVFQVHSRSEKADVSLESGLNVLSISGLKGTALYTFKADDGTTHSFIWKTKKGNVYIGLTNLLNDNLIVAKQLREAFGEKAGTTLLYLRLEDISPMSDEKLLLQAGTYLHKRHIPFILAVIPVYLNPETGDKVYLSDKPKMVKVLKKLQSMGGSIIVHGYTHAYRYSETGEGFEFWDA